MTEIHVNDLVLLSGRGEGAGGDFSSSRGAAASAGNGNNFDQSVPEHQPAGSGSGPITDEDIPF
jgi:hypothetical protein